VSTPKVSIRQIKAARALLGWSQEALSEASGVSLPTVKRLESRAVGDVGGRASTASKLVSALERGGVVFIDSNGGGIGVRLKSEF